MVRFKGTLVDVAGGSIDALPGRGGGGGFFAGKGRYLVLDNGFSPPSLGTPGAFLVPERFAGEGGSDINPFIEGGTTRTNNIVDLRFGADNRGVLNDVFAADPALSPILDNRPANAIAAIARLSGGLGGIGFDGEDYDQDMLLFVNLTFSHLENPALGITDLGSASTDMTPLDSRGFWKNPAFGGGGATRLDTLAPSEVYATLVPDGPSRVNATIAGAELFGVILEGIPNAFDVAYLVPLPGDFSGDGLVDGADLLEWQRNLGAARGSLLNDTTGQIIGVAQYELWQANFEATIGGVDSSRAVPEPASLLILAGLIAGGFCRRAD